MGVHLQRLTGVMPLIRPRLMIEAARAGARAYQRARDLPGALDGGGRALASMPRETILARLAETERVCEDLRRDRSPAYRPGRHVQVLAALLAEAGAAQEKASGSEALRVAT